MLGTLRPGYSVPTCALCRVQPPSVTCTCATDPISLCATCIPSHISMKGEHVLSQYESQQTADLRNSFCTLCKRNQADVLCPCTSPPALLCQQCILAHLNKYPLETHTCLPIDVLPYCKSRKYPEELKERKQKLDLAKVAATKNITQIESAEKATEEVYDNLIAAVTAAKREKLQEIQRAKEVLSAQQQAALQELEEHIYDGGYESSNPMTVAIGKSRAIGEDMEFVGFSQNPKALPDLRNLVQFSMNLSKIEKFCPRQVYLADLHPRSLRLFDCERDQWKTEVRLSAILSVDSGTCVLFLDDVNLFACGSYRPTSAKTWVVNTKSGEVEAMSDMRVARCQQGMLYVRKCVYAFGGYTSAKKNLKNCEKFVVAEKKWDPLPNMIEGRNCFNPCEYKSTVYLAGGKFSQTVELFNLNTETFSMSSLQLPKGEPSMSIVVDGDDLVFIKPDSESRCKLNGSDLEFRVKKFSGNFAWSNSGVVLIGGKVYMDVYWLKLVSRYNLREAQWERVSS